MKMQTHQELYALPVSADRSRRTLSVGMQRIFAWCREAARHVIRPADRRPGFASLSEMDDRMLRDIGLSRDDVHCLAPRTLWSEFRRPPFEKYR